MSIEGNLARSGNPHVAVDRFSAVYRGSESRFPINRDHSNLVKFSGNDPDYDTVASYLNEIAESLSLPEIIPSGSDNNAASLVTSSAGKSLSFFWSLNRPLRRLQRSTLSRMSPQILISQSMRLASTKQNAN